MSVLERYPSYRGVSLIGVRLIEVSVKRELTVKKAKERLNQQTHHSIGHEMMPL